MEIQIRPKDLLSLSKQDLQMQGNDQALALMQTGDHAATELIIQARKITEFLGSFVRAIESDAIAALEDNKVDSVAFGSTIKVGSTGDRLDYSMDPVWVELNNDLKAREGLLKVARKQTDPIYDNEGIEIPKVPVKTPSRSMLRVTL